MSTYKEQIKQAIIPVLRRCGVMRAALFGSTVRGKEPPRDTDILVQIGSDISLLGFVALKREIEHALQKNVDLVEYDTIKPRLREVILREQEPVL